MKRFPIKPVILFLIGIICGGYFMRLLEYSDRYEYLKQALQAKKHNDSADDLKEKVRILCFILTSPKSRRQSAIFVRETWGKRCNILLFMASYADNDLPTVALPSPEGYNVLWNKTKESFMHVFRHYEGKYDWVLKADDDTYTIMENLRFLLKDFDPANPLIFGDTKYSFILDGKTTPFMHGGEGYVLSREAVRRFVSQGVIGKTCDVLNNLDMLEDLLLAACTTRKLGVAYGNAFDQQKRSRYIGPLSNETFAEGAGKMFTLDFNRYSDTPIGFHFMTSSDMIQMEYLLYHVRVQGTPSRFP